MLLTAEQILAEGIVIPSEHSKPAQVGIDLSLASVHQCRGGSMVYKDRTEIDPEIFEEVKTVQVDGRECWMLDPGTYELLLMKGVRFLLMQPDLSSIEAPYIGRVIQLLARSGIQALQPIKWVRS